MPWCNTRDTHSEKKVSLIEMSFPYKRYITTISNQDPKLSALLVEWGDSHNFYPENLGNFLHYGIGLVSSIQCS